MFCLNVHFSTLCKKLSLWYIFNDQKYYKYDLSPKMS